MATIVATHERAAAAERILRAAIALFRVRGYHGSSMRTLARGLRMEAASLYYHFGSKQEILFAILDRTLDDLHRGGDVVFGPRPTRPRSDRRPLCRDDLAQCQALPEGVPVMTTDRPFTDKLEAPDVPKMPDEYQALLKRVLRIQADCEIGGPHLYVNQWLLTAPSADDQWMLAKVAGEEIDHFRKINRLLNDLGEDASELMYIEKSRRDLEAFRQAMPTWADVAAFGFLIDRVGQYQLEEFVGGSYAPLDRALPRIIQEEKTHVGYGLVKLRDMVRTEEGKALAQAAVDRWYPRGLDMFGRSNSTRAARYQYWGLKRRSNEAARTEYMAEVALQIEGLGLRVPDATSGRHFR